MGGGRLPAASGRKVLRTLLRVGFVIDRVVGSHHVMVFPSDPTRTVVVPVHGNRDLKPRDAGLDNLAGGIFG